MGGGMLRRMCNPREHSCLREEMDGMGEWQKEEEVVGKCEVDGGGK